MWSTKKRRSSTSPWPQPRSSTSCTTRFSHSTLSRQCFSKRSSSTAVVWLPHSQTSSRVSWKSASAGFWRRSDCICTCLGRARIWIICRHIRCAFCCSACWPSANGQPKRNWRFCRDVSWRGACVGCPISSTILCGMFWAGRRMEFQCRFVLDCDFCILRIFLYFLIS